MIVVVALYYIQLLCHHLFSTFPTPRSLPFPSLVPFPSLQSPSTADDEKCSLIKVPHTRCPSNRFHWVLMRWWFFQSVLAVGGGDLWTELPCNAISGITGNFTVPKLLIEYHGCGLNASGPGINRLKLLFRGAEHGMFIQANHETIPKLKAP